MGIDIGGSDPWLPISLSLVAFASFSWALRGHFETGGGIPKGMRLLSVVSLCSYITYVGSLFWAGHRSVGFTALGLAGFILSFVLFWWTVITTRQHRLRVAYMDADPDIIYTNGPYRYVRHPFYLSYIIFWIGTALIAGMWQWAPALLLSLWYIRVAQVEEGRFRSSTLSAGYDIYRRRTGMLLPYLGAKQASMTYGRGHNRQ